MSTYTTCIDGDRLLLTRCEGPFGLPVATFRLTRQDALSLAKLLAAEAKKLPLTSAGDSKP